MDPFVSAIVKECDQIIKDKKHIGGGKNFKLKIKFKYDADKIDKAVNTAKGIIWDRFDSEHLAITIIDTDKKSFVAFNCKHHFDFAF